MRPTLPNRVGSVHPALMEVIDGKRRTPSRRGVPRQWCGHLIPLSAATPEARDLRRKKLIAHVLDDLTIHCNRAKEPR